MIIIPELQKVVILTPRTGSGSLRRAIASRYPKSMLIYRHMEACGVPQGYDRWDKVGVVRNPVHRLWSLYKFLKGFGGDHDAAYVQAMRTSVDLPFSDWIVENEIVFTSPYDRAGLGRFYPQYTVRHPMPENWKSQFMYLRPELGTEIWQFERLSDLAERLGVAALMGNENLTAPVSLPSLDERARDHVSRVFKWEIDHFYPDAARPAQTDSDKSGEAS